MITETADTNLTMPSLELHAAYHLLPIVNQHVIPPVMSLILYVTGTSSVTRLHKLFAIRFAVFQVLQVNTTIRFHV